MNTQTTAPAGVVSSTELGFLREWADASGTHFVCRSHGLQTTNTVSHDDLLQLVQAAVAAERERIRSLLRAEQAHAADTLGPKAYRAAHDACGAVLAKL